MSQYRSLGTVEHQPPTVRRPVRAAGGQSRRRRDLHRIPPVRVGDPQLFPAEALRSEHEATTVGRVLGLAVSFGGSDDPGRQSAVGAAAAKPGRRQTFVSTRNRSKTTHRRSAETETARTRSPASGIAIGAPPNTGTKNSGPYQAHKSAENTIRFPSGLQSAATASRRSSIFRGCPCALASGAREMLYKSPDADCNRINNSVVPSGATSA